MDKMNRTITAKIFYTAVDITCPECGAPRNLQCKIGDNYGIHPDRLAKSTAMNRHPSNRRTV